MKINATIIAMGAMIKEDMLIITNVNRASFIW